MQLIQVKLSNIVLGDNISRAGVEHSESEIRAHADKIIANKFWDPPDVVRYGHKKDKYELVAGYLRIKAAILMVAESRLPLLAGDKNGVYVLFHTKTEYEKLTLNAAENIVRKNLSTYQTAHTLLNIQDEHGTDNHKLAASYGINVKTVANYIRAARMLITPIQLGWLNFEKSENPIPLMKLLAWAALTPEEQLQQFETSKWGRIYKMVDDQNKPRLLRRRSEIEKRLATEPNPDIYEALRWVLCLTEKDNERNDRNGSSNHRPTPRPAPSLESSNGSGSSVRPNEEWGYDSATEYASGAGPSRSTVDSPSVTFDNVRQLAQATPIAKTKIGKLRS